MLVIPPVYKKYISTLHGRVLLLGGADTGKTTFARLLYISWYKKQSFPCAFLDLDPGQTKLGLPGFHWGLINHGWKNERVARMLGSFSPRGYEQLSLENLKHLTHWLKKQEAEDIVLDTCGYIRDTGMAYKIHVAEIFAPRYTVIFSMSKNNDEEKLLNTLIKNGIGGEIIAFPPQAFVTPRTREKRIRYRNRQISLFAKRGHSFSMVVKLDQCEIVSNGHVQPLKKFLCDSASSELKNKLGALKKADGTHIPCVVTNSVLFEDGYQVEFHIITEKHLTPPAEEGIIIAKDLNVETSSATNHPEAGRVQP